MNTNTEKSSGENESERKLAQLCEKTFLSMWSYPNVFKDTNLGKTENSIGQEVCDLLVVFDNAVVIFSDKECAYKNTGNIDVDWPRWYRKAIETPARTAFGAEKWIKKYPKRVFVDKQCKVKLPVPLPNGDNCRYIKIVIAHSATQACKDYFGGNGALRICTSLNGEKQHKENPFHIGKIIENQFVHVLDDVTFETILSTLDTADDFLRYFIRKEDTIANGAEIVSSTELDLLTYHLQNPEGSTQKDFFGDGINALFLPEDSWYTFIKSEGWKNKQTEDRLSYYWDKLVETFYKFHISGELSHGGNGNPENFESAIRILAATSRLKRRILAKSFLGIINNELQCPLGGFRTVQAKNDSDPHYVLGVLPFNSDYPDYQSYKQHRLYLLSEAVYRTAYRINDKRLVIGITTELGTPKGRSEDIFIYKPSESFSKEEKDAYDKYVRNGGLKSRKETHVHEDQFPITKISVPNISVERNAKCPCGSGKKFKKCCQQQNK